MRRFPTSGSGTVTTSGSAVLSASPVYLNAVGLAAGTGSALATWYDGTSLATGSPKWTLAVSASNSENMSFPEPIKCACQLLINVLSGCAMTAWSR